MTLQSSGPARALRDPLSREIRRMAPWFHNLHLPSGQETAPDHPLGDFPRIKWRALSSALPEDLGGWRVLDVGCNAGFYTFELARRGADVLGIDADEHYLRQARWAAEQLGLDRLVRFEQRQVYDLAGLDRRFDLVLFMGVLYHLRHPLLALDLLAAKADRLLVLQTLTTSGEERAVRPPPDLPFRARARLVDRGWPSMAFVERSLAGDPTNWWVPTRSCVEAMLRSAGLDVLERRAEHELWICRPAGLPAAVRDELEAAVGRPVA